MLPDEGGICGAIPLCKKPFRPAGALFTSSMTWHRRLTLWGRRPLSDHKPKRVVLDKKEIQLLETYLKKRFNTQALEVRHRATKKDSAEVYIDEEFVGVIYVDEEDGERSYDLNIAILGIDLDDQ